MEHLAGAPCCSLTSKLRLQISVKSGHELLSRYSHVTFYEAKAKVLSIYKSDALFCWQSQSLQRVTIKGGQKRKRNVFRKLLLTLFPVFIGARKTLIKPPFFCWFWIMDRDLSNRRVTHSSQGARKHLESMSLVPGLTERWRVMNLIFVRDLSLSIVAHSIPWGCFFTAAT